MNNEELIWVPKDIAEKWKKLKDDETSRDIQDQVFEEYIDKVKQEVSRDFRCNLESLEEDAAMFTGLMIKVKKAFETTKNEQLGATEVIWENFAKDIPSTKNKMDEIVSILNPLTKELKEISGLLNSLNFTSIERLVEVVGAVTRLHGDNKEMFEFLLKNFKYKEKS